MDACQTDNLSLQTGNLDSQLFCLLEQPGDSRVEDDLLNLGRLTPFPEVQFLNYYKEVPVSAAARIASVTEAGLICRTSETQARVIEFSEYTIIKGAPFQHHVYAHAALDPDTRDIVLSDLRYVEVHSNRRASVRVRMQVPPVICIEAGTSKTSGRMLDLSLDGCAINIADRTLLQNFSYFYLTIDMPLKMQQVHVKPRVMAKLARLDQHNKLYRCIFLFEHNKSSEDQIGLLIARRQAEIIRELTC